jgi:uncharacterized protein with HEPN domain
MKEIKVYLLHILERVERAPLCVLGIDWESFQRDFKTIDAVTPEY